MISLNDIISNVNSEFADRKIYFGLSEVPESIILPESWKSFGLSLDEAPTYPVEWHSYVTEFPSVISLLNDSLLGTALLASEKVEMLYIFHDANGFYYYLGGLPIGGEAVDIADFDNIPARLQEFYREVHDGYTFFSARSMGPQRLRDLFRVSDLIDEEDVSFAENWIAVFSNGAGDYVAVDAKVEESGGLIWWHEEPKAPEFGVDIFEVMNAWMAIFLEDTKTRDELIAKLH